MVAFFGRDGVRGAAPVIAINAGGPATGTFRADQFFTAGAARIDSTMGDGELGTLRFGTSFAYDFRLPNGFYDVILTLLEPVQTAPGRRLFTVAANGQSSAAIDIFALAGLRTATAFPILAFVSAGNLHLQFTAIVGNAVVSAIAVQSRALGPEFPCMVLPATNIGQTFFVWAKNSDGSISSSAVISPRLAYHVVPAGTLDGANATFTLPDAPNPAISLVLSRNGLTLFPGVDYTLVGATITFLTGPAGSAIPNPGDILQAVSYQF